MEKNPIFFFYIAVNVIHNNIMCHTEVIGPFSMYIIRDVLGTCILFYHSRGYRFFNNGHGATGTGDTTIGHRPCAPVAACVQTTDYAGETRYELL